MPAIKRRQTHGQRHPTKRRKINSNVLQDEENGRPNEEMWESMPPFRRIQLKEQEDISEFAVDDVVLVLPPGCRPRDNTMKDDDFWMARIIEIRTTREQDDIWLKVLWFYKPEDTPGKVKGLKRGIFGRNERIASNHEDIIHWTTCEDVVQVRHYDENQLQQLPIDNDTYYYRYTYDCKKNSISNIPDICLPKCKNGYNPDMHEMRVCPSCAHAFHIACLSNPALFSRDGGTSTPASSRTLVQTPSLSKKRGVPRVPTQLQTLVQLPLLKGGPHGVVGNLNVVLAARALASDSSASGRSGPHWQNRLGGIALITELLGKPGQAIQMNCPDCGIAM